MTNKVMNLTTGQVVIHFKWLATYNVCSTNKGHSQMDDSIVVGSIGIDTLQNRLYSPSSV